MRRINYTIHLSDDLRLFPYDLPHRPVHPMKAAPDNIGPQIHPHVTAYKDFEIEALNRFENEGGRLGAAVTVQPPAGPVQ